MTHEKDKTTIEEIDCTEAIGQLYTYLDGEIDDIDTIRKLEHHMEHCKTCFNRNEVEKLLTARIKEAGDKPASESTQRRLRGIIDKL